MQGDVVCIPELGVLHLEAAEDLLALTGGLDLMQAGQHVANWKCASHQSVLTTAILQLMHMSGSVRCCRSEWSMTSKKAGYVS